MGRISALFKAEDDVFFVIEGTMSFVVDGHWIDAPSGSPSIHPDALAESGNHSRRRSGW